VLRCYENWRDILYLPWKPYPGPSSSFPFSTTKMAHWAV
jgi:hypothetical protein